MHAAYTCALLCACGILVLLRQSALSLRGRRVAPCASAALSGFLYTFLLIFYFPLSEGNKMDFYCVTAACNVSAASSCCIVCVCVFLCMRLYSNMAACWHVYILLGLVRLCLLSLSMFVLFFVEREREALKASVLYRMFYLAQHFLKGWNIDTVWNPFSVPKCTFWCF